MDLEFVRSLDRLECRLQDDLEVRRRAINNWKKLRLLIVLLIICGKSYKKNSVVKTDEESSKLVDEFEESE